MTKWRTIKLPKDIVDRIEDIVSESKGKYRSISEYIRHSMIDKLDNDEEPNKATNIPIKRTRRGKDIRSRDDPVKKGTIIIRDDDKEVDAGGGYLYGDRLKDMEDE